MWIKHSLVYNIPNSKCLRQFLKYINFRKVLLKYILITFPGVSTFIAHNMFSSSPPYKGHNTGQLKKKVSLSHVYNEETSEY
jgi:hypothetical protein